MEKETKDCGLSLSGLCVLSTLRVRMVRVRGREGLAGADPAGGQVSRASPAWLLGSLPLCAISPGFPTFIVNTEKEQVTRPRGARGSSLEASRPAVCAGGEGRPQAEVTRSGSQLLTFSQRPGWLSLPTFTSIGLLQDQE